MVTPSPPSLGVIQDAFSPTLSSTSGSKRLPFQVMPALTTTAPSRTIGRPLSLLLSQRGPGANAVVTVVHSGVRDLAIYTRQADIVVSGVGQPGIVQPDMVREGAVLVSAGITWKGKRLLPDVDESVGEKASWITPRLGGLGVTTVAMLLQNAVGLAERQSQESALRAAGRV